MEGFTYGNEVVADFTYSAERLQLETLKYTKDATTLLDLSYCYRDFTVASETCSAQNGGNNGQITGIVDNTGDVTATGEDGRTVGYSYDALERLKTAETKGSAAYARWKYDYEYDRYGNRTEQDLLAGTGPEVFLTYSSTTNRITTAGYSYDASGNLTDDNVNTYKYDGEGRIRWVNGGSTAKYLYGPAGIRIEKWVSGDGWTVHVFSGTKVIADYALGADPATTPAKKEYIYLGSKLLATIDTAQSPEVITYHHQDHLSVRVNTDSAGERLAEQGHLPFGESWYSGSGSSKWKFTSYERDSETGLDYAMFRYDSTRLGRFLTPDPISGSIADPQTLNRYAYTRNDPINLIDPLGLHTCEIGWTSYFDRDGNHICQNGEGDIISVDTAHRRPRGTAPSVPGGFPPFGPPAPGPIPQPVTPTEEERPESVGPVPVTPAPSPPPPPLPTFSIPNQIQKAFDMFKDCIKAALFGSAAEIRMRDRLGSPEFPVERSNPFRENDILPPQPTGIDGFLLYDALIIHRAQAIRLDCVESFPLARLHQEFREP